MSDILTRLLLDSSNYDKNLKKAKNSTDEFAGNLGGKLTSAVSKFAAGIGVAVGGVETFRKMMDSTQTTGDLMRGTMHALKTSVDEFFYSVNRGNLSLFISNLGEIASKARGAYDAIDQLGNTQISYGVLSAKNQASIAEAQYIAKNKFAPTQARASAFGTWGAAIASEEQNIKSLQDELVNTVTKTVGSRITANLEIGIEDVIRAFETDLKTPAARELAKSRAEMGMRNYEANAKRKDWTQEQKDQLAEIQKENIITYTMLQKFNDEQLQQIASQIQQYYQLTSAVKGLGREYNETANEFNNANKNVAGFIPVSSLNGYTVYSGGEAGRNFSATGKNGINQTKSIEISALVGTNFQYNTELGEKVLKAMRGDGRLPIITQPIEIDEVVEEEPLPGLSKKIDDIGKINEELEVFGSIMSMVNGTTAAGSEGWLQWMNNVIQATSAAIVAIRQVVAAKTAEGAAAAGASAAASGPFGWLMIAPAIMSAIAAFGSIPKFAQGGIIGGSSFVGDKLLARVNSGEMILNQNQQSKLLAMTSGHNVRVSGDVKLNGKDIYISLRNYMSASGNRL